MITIITGKPGSGKTLFMTYKAIECVCKGQDVYANWSLDFFDYFKKFSPEKLASFGHVYFWAEIGELYAIKGGQIFIDEAQDYFDAREWQDMPPSAKKKFSAHRHDVRKDKNGKIIPLDIWASVQHLSNMDKRIRDLGQHFCVVKNLFKLRFSVKYFEMRDLKDDLVKRKSLYSEVFWFDKRRANCYDTFSSMEFVKYPEFRFIRRYGKPFCNRNNGLESVENLS